MVAEVGKPLTAIVVADDAELGGLITLNLRRRGLVTEQTDFVLAASPRWMPANGRPRVAVFDAERPETDITGFVRRVQATSWMMGVPLVVAADRPLPMVDAVARRGTVIFTRPDDVGCIVSAALVLSGNPAPGPPGPVPHRGPW